MSEYAVTLYAAAQEIKAQVDQVQYTNYTGTFDELPVDSIYISRWQLHRVWSHCVLKFVHSYYWRDDVETVAHNSPYFKQVAANGKSFRSILRDYANRAVWTLRELVTILGECCEQYRVLGIDSCRQALSTAEIYEALRSLTYSIVPRQRKKYQSRTAVTPEVLPQHENTATQLLQQLTQPPLFDAEAYIKTAHSTSIADMLINARVQGIITLKRRQGESPSQLFKRISDMNFSDSQLVSVGSQGCVVRIYAPKQGDTELSPSLISDIRQQMDKIVARWASWKS